MGVKIGGLIPTRQLELTDLAGKTIGIDGYNVAYQFLARIRRSPTGEPLKDRKGNVTSHLSGIFYRTSSLIGNNINPLFVWDGKPPRFKKRTVEARRAIRENAAKKWAIALKRGEEAMVYAQAALTFTQKMVGESIELLNYMGIPSIRAPSEGEAQLAVMATNGDIWASASQDWDSLLFNSPRLVRNLSITGRKKLPRKSVYVQIKPEIVELDRALGHLEITREQLIILGILVGTDYNEGVKGIGPKTALKLVKSHKNLADVLPSVGYESDGDIEQIFNFFMNPPATKTYEVKRRRPDSDRLIEFMVEMHDFSRMKVEKVVDLLEESFSRSQKERKLEMFFG